MECQVRRLVVIILSHFTVYCVSLYSYVNTDPITFRVFSANNIAVHERFHADFHKQWDAQRWSYFLLIS